MAFIEKDKIPLMVYFSLLQIENIFSQAFHHKFIISSDKKCFGNASVKEPTDH